MATTVRVDGVDELVAKLRSMGAAVAGARLEAALRAGLLPVQNQAKINVHKITSTLARSIHTETAATGPYAAEGRCGSNLEYARREEYLAGGGHAYLRPAWDAKQGEARDEVREALRELVRQSAS